VSDLILDDLELELRKLPGVRAAGFDAPALDFELAPLSPHLPDITRCAASATASAMIEPNLVALAIMLLAALGFAAKRLLNNLLLLVSLVQFLDALIDVGEGRLPVAIGVIILAVLFSAASASLSGYPFWQIRAWKETD